MQQIATSYYSFEPLISVHPKSAYRRALLRIFRCQFGKLARSHLKPSFWKVTYMRWNGLLNRVVGPAETDSIQLFNTTLHRLVCRHSRLVLVKTIRFTVDQFWD